MRYTRFNTIVGEIALVGNEEGLTTLHMNTEQSSRTVEINKDWVQDETFFAGIKEQLLAYFDGRLTRFDVLLNPQGTAFQQQVWAALRAIPFGQVRSYKDIAISIGNPNACRAVGMANAKNPIPIIVPCHRVIGSNGTLTGYALGLETKKKLLSIEGIKC
ncbi:methylated-DNA--[protein]-cysteine S-methyltransferase [Pseudodesulfovibrio sediminis]|uniref:Methylated-DNA--protein-cysteine methyltransferase n=1 Tax=Pseudodesulfovibrio sediminis TaxID=2810563 RepID=A0ABN6ETY1_9BACT|nr:methylated-DNA--[protein]-cysteine S-methyltransferase [Pseudodesulfovibrio sediminis]BCS89791.1 methylated-DNA--protein-cysteine methyltransferase [Pseudodesulfovibrio sediminis]